MSSEALTSSVLREMTDDEVIRRLGRRSPDVWDKMIEEEAIIPDGAPLCRSPASSAGNLDRLPPETLVLVLQNLDFQSVSRFMAASFRTMEIVQSMPAYQDLLGNASSTLIVLGKTNLAGHHNILDLHTALTSESCLSCQRFGAHIFLPSCERACLNCLHRNMRFWVLPAKEAQMLYGIPQKEMHRLPGMMSLQVGKRRGRRQKLVSVKLARELGLDVHGSEQEMASWVLQSGKLGNKRDSGKLNEYSWWAGAGEKLVEWDNEEVLVTPRSTCWGYASMRFPHLRPDHTVDPGYWCEGCRFKRTKISAASNYSHGMDYICATPEDEKELAVRHREELREWSRSGLLKHVLTCSGVEELLKQEAGLHKTGDE